MTDTEIARRIRAAAQAMRDPLSVNCVACKVMAGEECIDNGAERQGRGTEPGVHRIRAIDARITADGRTSRLLVEIADNKENA